ncbi:RNA-directed DNA polymerase (Reverse transcriptase) [Chthoniobacter flavus Ellin428]|uniref:RNA-directed DNA polymerase n=2 Tax=Chthoniobacter flavus TaxID=191863 RepID=B4D2Q7_9BACT|nr:group II intron reverse transcriptase/maturase [Chthoniobacter flavus]EDY19497.1 RNA-directed DNA polymerase (Reverse transcriptase) [Chthoniobacter flavus Ellin428]
MIEQLMEEAVSPENWHTAWKAVVSNGGAPGIDGMRCSELVEHLQRHGEAIRAKLLAGRYTPSPVKRTKIPKPGGGERDLGIPTVMDRFVQQLLLQVLTPIYEPRFSARSYGFRPGRSTHDAVRQAQACVKEGKSYVIDLDIEKFFDRVNHNLLMHRLRETVSDVRVRTLIGRYLKAGVMVNGVVQDNEEGTPQGGPLSPLLANIYLDPLDWELEGRGLAYVRYADDCNIYVSSAAAAQRVLSSLIGWIEKKLRLKVNQTKSGTGPTTGRRLLGFSINAQGVIEIAQKSLTHLQEKVRAFWRPQRHRGNQEMRDEWNQYVRGWCSHFALAQEVRWVKRVDGWIRRHIRKYYWQRWHCTQGRLQAFQRLGISRHHWVSARSSRGAWCMAGSPALQAAISVASLRRYGYLMPSVLLAR